MKYYYSDRSKAPIGKPIWGLAYDINDDTERHDLRCEPALSEYLHCDVKCATYTDILKEQSL